MEWGVETMHWLLDVRYREDYFRAQNENIQKNMNMSRKLALNLARIYKNKHSKKTPLSHNYVRLPYVSSSFIDSLRQKLSSVYDEELKICLCAECRELFLYAHERLQACPHEEKPRCRVCKNPCYERTYWKKMAKMMRYSGMRLGFLKLKEKLKATLD